MESAMTTERARKRYVSLRVKIWIGFILIFTPVFVASYYWFYQYTADRVFKTISDKLVDTINGAVQGMDTDSFTKLYQEESSTNPQCSPSTGNASGYYPDNPLYTQHEDWLRTVQEIASSAAPDNPANIRIYTYVKGPNPGDVVAVGSTGYFRNPRGGFKFCELYHSKTTRIADGLTGRVDSWTIYTDKYGSWITTYQPIVDKNGQNIGGIGVDMPADYVNEVKQGILVSGAIAFVISYVLIFLLVYWLSGLLTRPIVSLAGVAKDIGDGNYEQEWSRVDKQDAFRDEIDTLTSVFRAMVDKVAEREKSLRARVAQLEILIDRSKLETQVQEIVDSDFFQDLRSKVQDMRSRFKDEPDDDKKKKKK
ncbi:MAG TPA: HAMP domain-containing protein [Anaerolineales bacterium]|nr:HAMP domain-containing protein [Anaerolineales bacterium]